MTSRLRNLILMLCALFTSNAVQAFCPTPPAGYTTSEGSFNTIANFTVSYPATVQVGQPFNIYICVDNVSASDRDVTLSGFLPDYSAFTVDTPNCCITIDPAGTTLDTTTPGGTNGIGQFANAALTTLQVMAATITLTPTSSGVYRYTPAATCIPNGGESATFPEITITAITCPTITADSATECDSGTLVLLVSGGHSPYTFFATGTESGGTVTVNTDGDFTFSTNSGSFQYYAVDASGCLSSVGTIDVSSPVAGNDVLFTTTAGVPAVGPLNFSGGTAPYTYTTVTAVNILLPVQYNTPSVGEVTITQTAPGASLLQYTVMDANGCEIDRHANIYVYSCSAGLTASAVLDNDAIYSICYPSTVALGSTFPIVVSISNPNTALSPATVDFEDIVPDNTQPSAAGLLFISNTTPPAGTTFDPLSGPYIPGNGGKGDFMITAGSIPVSTSYSVTETIMATASGLQTYIANLVGNPPPAVPEVEINVLPCPSILASSETVTGCSGVIVGSLAGLVTGGVSPYTFNLVDGPTCGELTISSTGAYLYTAPIGFTGPCEFLYDALDQNACPSNVAEVTISANLGPVTSDVGPFDTCEGVAIIDGPLAVSGGTPPITFSIVTPPADGVATIPVPTEPRFDYTPNPGFFGGDSFTYDATDANDCVSNVSTVSILVRQNPVISVTGATGCINHSVTGNLSSFVTGGTPPYTFALVGTPVNGTVTINTSTGAFTFTPTAGFIGVGSFQFQVTDSAGCVSSVATVTVTIGTCCPALNPFFTLVEQLYWNI